MSLKKQIASGAIWTIIGQIGYMAISLITNILLARLLTPFEFGEMGILMFFVLIANILTQSGFGGALLRRVTVSEKEYSTVFVFNLIMSIICYIILILFSNQISQYYRDPKLKELLFGVGLIFVINALSMVQNTKLTIEMKFKQKSIILFTSNFFAAIISLYMAYTGWGVWALVAFQLLTSVFNSLLLIVYTRMKLSFRFSFPIFKDLYGFGINTTMTSILSTAFDNIYQLILGRFFSIGQVGYFYQAKKLQIIPFTVLNSVIQSVMFSSLAKLQNEKEAFLRAYNRLMLIFAIVMVAITCFIVVYAEGIILLLFGEQWLGAAFFMQLLSIASFFYFQELINNIIFKVFDKTKQILYLEILKKAIQSISILIGIATLNMSVLLVGFILSSVISYGLNFYYSRKILGKDSFYEIFTILKLISVSAFCVLFCKYSIDILKFSPLGSLLTLPFAIFIFYFFLKITKVADLAKEIKSISSLAGITK
ncbi:lipopolysaccharide biosynthesis protein [Niabella terrae]